MLAGMRELDLEPEKYRVQTKRGTWVSRDDWRIALPYGVVIAVGFIVFAWWHRAELTFALLVGAVAVASLLLGILIGAWLKRFD